MKTGLCVFAAFFVISRIGESDAQTPLCWWSNCELSNNSPCPRLNADTSNVRVCDNYAIGKCCEARSARLQPLKRFGRSRFRSGCRWTTCQPDIWATKGCESEGMQEINKTECEDGHEYHCCPKESNNVPVREEVTVSTTSEKCSWTKCVPKKMLTQECNGELKDKKSCGNSFQFQCCMSKKVEFAEPATAPVGSTNPKKDTGGNEELKKEAEGEDEDEYEDKDFE